MSAGLQDVDIANMALSHLGISNTIQSLTPPDPSDQAQTCAFWYPKSRDKLIQSAPWNFSYTSINLAQEPVPSSTGPLLGYAAPGWQYSYQYPGDCLQPIALTTIAGFRNGPQFWVGYWWPSVGLTLTIPKIPYKIIESQANPGQLAILCDILATAQSPLYLFYIQQVTNTAQFDPMFCDALAWQLAADAGGKLRANAEKVAAAKEEAKQSRLAALAQHLNASQQDPERDSPSIQARW